jgi:DNA end-binding protein Ku
MAARAIASGTISFGLVSIPVKVYTAASPQKVRFNMLEATTGARLKQQYLSTVSGEVVERADTVKGFEYARGQYVTFDAEELKAIEADRTNTMDIVEFVPLDSVDLVSVEKSYFIGPDKGGDKAYRLLSQAMHRKGQVAVGRWQARGKEQLVLIRPYQDGLVLHQMFYASEVRAFDDIDQAATFDFPQAEMDLADNLIEQLSVEKFTADQYSDSYTERVRVLVDKKVAGQEITVSPEQPKAQIIDLFEALKQSLDEAKSGATDDKKRATTAPKKAPKKATNKPAKGVKKAAPRKSRAKKTKAS